MKEVKEENNIMGYNIMKFNVVKLNLVFKNMSESWKYEPINIKGTM